jgi:hypothetical protein
MICGNNDKKDAGTGGGGGCLGERAAEQSETMVDIKAQQ